MREVMHLSIYIASTPKKVYEFASDPLNLPLWATGLASSNVTKEDNNWIVEAPFGKVKVTFVEQNKFGVMDHEVALESGLTFYNPMRVIPNGKGSEFVFTLIRQADMTDEQFLNDKASIERDLETLKA